MRRTLCRSGIFQYYDDLQIWNPFSNVLESNSLPSPDYYQKQTLLEGFPKVVWTLWEMRLQGRYGATILSPTSHVPMCALSEKHQFLGETKSVQMELHTCVSTCANTYTHNNRSPSHNTQLTVELCLIIPFRISNDSGCLQSGFGDEILHCLQSMSPRM